MFSRQLNTWIQKSKGWLVEDTDLGIISILTVLEEEWIPRDTMDKREPRQESQSKKTPTLRCQAEKE